MNLTIRPAEKNDHPALSRMLLQIARLHADMRPEIFKEASRKYGREQLAEMLQNPDTPVLVAADGQGQVLGYAMLQVKTVDDEHPVLRQRRFLYMDDLCVDEAARGLGIGKALMDAVQALALERGLEKIELNVWESNQSALQFYEKLGFHTQRRQLELDI